MRRLLVLAAALVALIALAPGAAAAAGKKKPAAPVYELSGTYTHASVAFLKCDILTGGSKAETTKVIRTYTYSGDTKSGITVVQTEQYSYFRDVYDSDYVTPLRQVGETTTTQREFKGSEVISRIKNGKAMFSYAGIGDGYTAQSFKLPKKGRSTPIKIDTNSHASEPDRPAGCEAAYETTEVVGTVNVRRK